MGIFAGGNPAGSGGTSGTGTGLTYILDRAFAYSGTVTCDNNDVTMLNFTTGGFIIVARWQPFFTGATNTTNNMIWRMNVNGEKSPNR